MPKKRKEIKFKEHVDLKKLMRLRKVSYKKISENINMSMSALNNKVNGYTDFTKNEMIEIAKILKLSETEFIKLFMINLK